MMKYIHLLVLLGTLTVFGKFLVCDSAQISDFNQEEGEHLDAHLETEGENQGDNKFFFPCQLKYRAVCTAVCVSVFVKSIFSSKKRNVLYFFRLLWPSIRPTFVRSKIGSGASDATVDFMSAKFCF